LGGQTTRTLNVTITIAVLRATLLAVAALFGGSMSAAADKQDAATIVLAPGPLPQALVEIHGLRLGVLRDLKKLDRADPRWKQILGVFVVETGSSETRNVSDRPAMLGSFEVDDAAVRFKPRFALERGLAYRVLFDSGNVPGLAAERVRVEKTFTIPAAYSAVRTRLSAIYPSSAELPENLLRVYLQFSAPMSQGHSYGYLHLRDETGAVVEGPFLQLPQELWSPDGTRLTLLLDPGRVKQGLKPREESGAVLTAGHSYTLTVDSSWPDAEGRPLADSARKTFRALPPVTTQPDPKSWKIEPPAGRSRDALSVKFPEPLDHGMLLHVLHVFRFDDAKGIRRVEVDGTVKISDEEKHWSFVPRDAWRAGHYSLAVDSKLEDRAGNNIARPFEVDLNRPQPTTAVPAFIQLEFIVRDRR
jgi:hypothetical protein